MAGEALARFPDRFEGSMWWAEVAMLRRDWPQASERWEEFRRTFPEYLMGYVRGAKALIRAGRLEEAETLAIEAVSRFPGRPGGHIQRAEVTMRRGDWALASERWKEIRRAFPDHPSGYVRGAKALMDGGRLEEAEALVCETRERFPERSEGSVPRTGAAMRPGGRTSDRAPTGMGGET